MIIIAGSEKGSWVSPFSCLDGQENFLIVIVHSHNLVQAMISVGRSMLESNWITGPL